MPSFDVDRIDATIRALRVMPPGALAPFAGAVAPSGFLFCDGSAVSRTTYSALFAAIGTTYGVGDGSATFNVPDLRSRMPVGAGPGPGLTNRSLAATGGEESHTLTAAESGAPAHAHPFDGDAHFKQSREIATTPGGGLFAPATGTVANAGNTGASTAADAAQPHNTMPPFLAVNWIIAT